MRSFYFPLSDVNEAPTSIILAPQTLPENSPAGTRIGSIEVIDPDLNSTASCRIVEGSTEYFAVSGRYLVAGQKKVDYEALGSTKNLDLKLRCIDEFGLFLERRFHITIRGKKQRSNMNLTCYCFCSLCAKSLEKVLNFAAFCISNVLPDKTRIFVRK